MSRNSGVPTLVGEGSCQTALPDRLPAPEPTHALRRAMDLVRLDERRHLAGIAPALALEAHEMLADLKWLCEPAPLAVVDAWMELLFVGVCNPPNPKGRLLRVGAVMGVSGDLPRACWTVETYRGYVRHHQDKADWWPGPGMVDAFLRPIGRELTGQRTVCERIASLLAHETPAAAPEPHTPEERAAITRDILARWRVPHVATRREGRSVEQQIEAVAVKQGPQRSRYPTADQLRAMREARRREMGLPPLRETPDP